MLQSVIHCPRNDGADVVVVVARIHRVRVGAILQRIELQILVVPLAQSRGSQGQYIRSCPLSALPDWRIIKVRLVVAVVKVCVLAFVDLWLFKEQEVEDGFSCFVQLLTYQRVEYRGLVP